jgi:hypothetical protein
LRRQYISKTSTFAWVLHPGWREAQQVGQKSNAQRSSGEYPSQLSSFLELMERNGLHICQESGTIARMPRVGVKQPRANGI